MRKNVSLPSAALALYLSFFAVFTSHANASVVTYPAPSGGIPLSNDFTVTADGLRVDVYQVKVPPQYVGYDPCPSSYEIASMAYFDFSGTVDVQITSAIPISNVVVRPLRYNIQPNISGNTISFSLSQPGNLSIEINGDDRHNLHLFANPIEVNKPSPSDPNVIYYGPGVHGDGSSIGVQAGKTVYIAGGAIVYGSVYAGNNTTIRGRGIISGGKTPKRTCIGDGGTVLIALKGGTLNLEGIIALDTSSWTFLVSDADNFTMDNVKSIGWRGNGDGLAITSATQATVKNIFVRSTDDIFAIKSDPHFMAPTGRSTENIVIQDSVNWGDGAGHSIAFMEQSTPYIRNVQIKNIDILHSYVPAVFFSCCDLFPGEQYNITLDDVRVEDMKTTEMFEFSGRGNSGHIRDVNINNFSLLGGNIAPSNISGTDSGSVSNITFNNLKYLGRNILSASEGQFKISGNTSNINFTSSGSVLPTPTPTPSSPLCTNFWDSTLGEQQNTLPD